MSLPTEILLVDDEATIRLTLGAMLERAGYAVTVADCGEEAITWLERQAFALLLVDLKMPGIDGVQVIAAARARQPEIAIIVLTGHGSLETAITGLHYQVFDYLLKTTSSAQVIERVKAGLAARAQALRQHALINVVGAAVQELRTAPSSQQDECARPASTRLLVVGALKLDIWRQEATLAGRTLALTPTEFRVLLCLAEHAGTMLPYAELVRSAQGYDTGELEAGELIKPHIHHLRQKLESDSSAPRYILNVRGKGYLLAPLGG